MINKGLNDLAIQLVSPQEALFAAYAPDGSIDVIRLPLDAQLAVRLREWRENFGATINLHTEFRFLPLFSTENTRQILLDDSVVALPDDELVLWLVESEKMDRADLQGNPIFDSPFLKEGQPNTVYDYTRLKNGAVTLTELPYKMLEITRKTIFGLNLFDSSEVKQFSNLPEAFMPSIPHHVDSRMRSVLRYAVKTDHSLENLRHQETDDQRVFIFLGLELSGCAFAIWSPALGIISEVGEVFHEEEALAAPPGMSEEEYRYHLYKDHLEQFIASQLDEYLITSPELRIDSIRFAQSQNVPWNLSEILKLYAKEKDLPLHKIDNDLNLEQITVRGVLLAADEEAATAVPPVNLAWDLKNRAEQVYVAQDNAVAEQFLVRKRSTNLLMLAPVAICAALLVGWFVTTWQYSLSLAYRESKATAEENRLKPILESRNSYEKTFDWYQDLLRQMTELRNKQTLAYGFATRLNYMYPSDDDSFYLSQLVVKPGGLFEINGLTMNKDSVTSLVRTLESATDEDSKKLFDGLQLDYKQGSEVEVKSSIGGGSGAVSGGNLKPGINAFSVKGTYLPMGILKTSPPSSNPVTPTATVAPTVGVNPAPPNAASPNQPPISSPSNPQPAPNQSKEAAK